MADATPTGDGKGKVVSKASKGGAVDGASDNKKRFEVKKVWMKFAFLARFCPLTVDSGTLLLFGHGTSWLITALSAEITSWISVSTLPPASWTSTD